MRSNSRWVLPSGLLGLIMLPSLSAAAPRGPAPNGRAADAGRTVELWTRSDDRAGNAEGDRGGRTRPAPADLDAMRLVDLTRPDAQLGGVRGFRGIPIAELIEGYGPDASSDLALLHFANGMVVPLPFRDAPVMARLAPFVARGMESYRRGPIRIGRFPALRKKDAYADARPIVFTGNKVVVSDLWHPSVGSAAQAAFSPWAHTDSLVGIELVAADGYYRQFDVGGSPEIARGLELFKESCQFCHGARKVGAAFGWDFVEPQPIFSYRRSAKNLFFHVAYQPYDAAERGLMMPALKSTSETEAALLWQWLRAIATKPMPHYVATGRAPTRSP